MMQSGTGTTVAATFPDRATADACLSDLRAAGLSGAWLAVTKSGAPEPSSGGATSSETAQHAVSESSDGIIGAIGRYFSGELSLRRSLVDHGVSEADAREMDESLPADGAVVVIRAGDRVDAAASILSRAATRVFGAEGERFARYPSTTDTVPGQGDELDRGSDRGRSGGGLGATTGYWSEGAAREDMRASGIGELGEGSRGAPADDVYYERGTHERS